MTTRELADLAIDLTRQISDVRAQRDSYRLLAVQAIHRLHEQHVELTRLRERHHRLIAEYRDSRVATIRTPERAA